MSRTRHVYSFVSGAVMLWCSWLLFRSPNDGIEIIPKLLSLSLLLLGIRLFVYYFTMARHMVGGLSVLLIAVFVLDLAMFTASVEDGPRLYTILYLFGYHAFSGLVNLLRGLEEKRYHSPVWKQNVLHGSVDFLIALGCIVFIRSRRMLVYAFCLTLAWSAVMRILAAFKKTAVIYIGP